MMVSTSMSSTSGSTKVIDFKKRGTTNVLSVELVVIMIVINYFNYIIIIIYKI